MPAPREAVGGGRRVYHLDTGSESGLTACGATARVPNHHITGTLMGDDKPDSNDYIGRLMERERIPRPQAMDISDYSYDKT
jgi:hypothetical protein